METQSNLKIARVYSLESEMLNYYKPNWSDKEKEDQKG